jgi:hypothetical protein
MLGGFEAALIFLLLVMPGAMFVGGLNHGRERPPDASVVRSFAQAISASLVCLAPAIIVFASDFARSIPQTVDEQLTELIIWGYATVFVPWFAGLVVGRAGWVERKFHLPPRRRTHRAGGIGESWPG